jgi:hypothetical protein
MIPNIKYKKVVALAIVIGLPLLFTNFTTKYIKSSGAHPGTTGAPGEETCAMAGCHSPATVNYNVAGVNIFTFPTADSSYVPGQTYTISLKAQKASVVKFGFEIVALEDSGNTNVGKWTLTDSVRVQEISDLIGGGIRRFLTHTFDGNSATGVGENVWSFKWTAPATDEGDITFYFASNCTNNDGYSTGDDIYLNSFKIHSAANSINEFVNEQKSNIYFIPSSNEIVFDYVLKADKRVSFYLVDAFGRTVYETKELPKNAGRNVEKINISNDVVKGVYLANVKIGNSIMTKKVIID